MTVRQKVTLSWHDVDEYLRSEEEPTFAGEIECSSLTVARQVLKDLDKRFKLDLNSDIIGNVYVGDYFVSEIWHGITADGELVSFCIEFQKYYCEKDP